MAETYRLETIADLMQMDSRVRLRFATDRTAVPYLGTSSYY